ncbi:DUF3043 domain-containing protein [Haloechinothrix sp. LS1_15]|uniref:DUF3043 domain-containing protein n=1 Tax=Haloechinothrix sp. LS1_15 TaxID=2652248 RepID=UPI0029440B2B|nr:DUF3043 domain-containing protein [Haloechinothrix sp. LS1_15]MDV6012721.1 DUF3043 domain-containing protein [Haloechinothrix sp. LS1_15]
MRFFRRNTSAADNDADSETEAGVDEVDQQAPKGATPKKGRPTPRRNQAAPGKRGPVPPPPRNTREAIKRSRQLRKQSPASKMTKEERKAAAKERRERMMAGDERYLLPRDRGPVKAFVRDVVDSRRNLLGLFMPLAIIVFMSLLVPDPAIQQWATLVTTVMLFGMVIEGVSNGRRITRLAREHFPNETIKGRSIGWYAFVRATQLRRLRVPRPRVKPGDPVKVR